MFRRFHFSRRFKLLLLAAIIAALSFGTYRFFHPPLPHWFQTPPGSSVLVSRRFHPLFIMREPLYYCRIHSPLSGRETAAFLISQPNVPDQPIKVFTVTQSDSFRLNFGGNGLEPEVGKKGIDVYFYPDQILGWATEVESQLKVWPEEKGSIIEFYVEGGF